MGKQAPEQRGLRDKAEISSKLKQYEQRLNGEIKKNQKETKKSTKKWKEANDSLSSLDIDNEEISISNTKNKKK